MIKNIYDFYKPDTDTERSIQMCFGMTHGSVKPDMKRNMANMGTQVCNVLQIYVIKVKLYDDSFIIFP